MLSRKDMFDDVRLGAAVIQNYIGPGGKLNLNDASVHAEELVADLLNALMGWQLTNNNVITANYPCIDLIDEINQIGVQVTAESGSKKINETLECVHSHGLSSRIGRLLVFSLVRKQQRYTVKSLCPGVAFTSDDIVDFDVFLQRVKSSPRTEALPDVHAVFRRHLPAIYADARSRLKADREQLAENLALFDRQVFRATKHLEDPYEMLISLHGIRTSLQRAGTSVMPNKIGRDQFNAIKKCLAACEQLVFEQAPFLRRALRDARRPSYDEYVNDSYGATLDTMMAVREPIAICVSLIERELERIDACISV